jgi:glyoxylate reductase
MTAKPLIAVTRKLPDAGMEMLTQASDVDFRVFPEDRPPTRVEMIELFRGARAAITLVTDPVDGEVLDACPDLRALANYAVGYDNIKVPDATARGVYVTNTPGVLTETTADFTFALLIAAARRVVEAADYVREGKWKTWSPTLFLGWDLHDATIGIVGYGRIGKQVARRAAGFDMRVLVNNRSPVEAGDIATAVDLDLLLKESDFVCLNVALTPETNGMIGKRELELMKPSAILINAARGPVVQTDALYEALVNGVIAGAALDVTDPEPLPPDHPLIGLPNCLIAPHIASATVATRSKMATMAVSNALAAVRGQRPPNLVNESTWTEAS